MSSIRSQDLPDEFVLYEPKTGEYNGVRAVVDVLDEGSSVEDVQFAKRVRITQILNKPEGVDVNVGDVIMLRHPDSDADVKGDVVAPAYRTEFGASNPAPLRRMKRKKREDSKPVVEESKVDDLPPQFKLYEPTSGEFDGARAVYELVDELKTADGKPTGYRIRILKVLAQPKQGEIKVGDLIVVRHPDSDDDIKAKDPFAKSPAYRENFGPANPVPLSDLSGEGLVSSPEPEPELIGKIVEDTSRPGRFRRVTETGVLEEGTFVDGKLEGPDCRRTSKNEDGEEVVWEGVFSNGYLNGLGRITVGGKLSMEGEFRDSFLFGKGKKIYRDGTIKEGDFGDLEWLKEGKIIRPNGTIEGGTFKDGKHLHGKGMKTISTQDEKIVFLGDFVDGVPNGLCLRASLMSGNMLIVGGEFLVGEFVSGFRSTARGMSRDDLNLFFSNLELMFSGLGSADFDSDLEKYLEQSMERLDQVDWMLEEGTFKDGKHLHGKGKRRLSNGQVEEGEFVDGVFQTPKSGATPVEVEEEDDNGMDGWAKVDHCQTLTTLSRKERALSSDQIQLRGHPYKRERLTVEDYFKVGLGPEFKMEVGKTAVYFSKMYHIDGGRLAVVAYMPKEDGSYVARSFYLSNSQTSWRYLPSYSEGPDGSIDWFNKGHGEASLNLPFSLQEDLGHLMERASDTIIDVENADAYFACTAKNMTLAQRETVRHEVSPKPRRLKGALSDPHLKLSTAPASLQLDASEEPNFEGGVLHQWEVNSPLYGPVHMEVFSSRDDSLRFLFCRDARGRVWIGGIEDVSGNAHQDRDIQSVGLFKNWVDAPALTAPAYEYSKQTGGFGNFELRNGHYVDMYKNYLSKILVIQGYNARLKKKEDERLGRFGKFKRWVSGFGKAPN